MSTLESDIVSSRRDRLREAKRRQRERERRAEEAVYQVRLPIEYRERLKAGMRIGGFLARFRSFLDRELIRVDSYPTLAQLCWNRNQRYVTREDAFQLYERSGRLVDAGSLDRHEAALVGELKEEFGRGLVNA